MNKKGLNMKKGRANLTRPFLGAAIFNIVLREVCHSELSRGSY